MKITKTVLTAAMLLLLVFSGCGDGLGDQGIETGKSNDFEVDLRTLNLVRELGTVWNIPIKQSDLRFKKIPDFATRNTVIWESSDTTVATIDPSTGAINITTGDPNVPVSTIIKVKSVYDPSVCAECVLTVYPIYALPRMWNFSAGTVKVDGDAIVASSGTQSSAWTSRSSNADLGYGAVILGETGAASDYNSQGPGVYIIDPDDPYKFGVTLSEESRNWHYVTSVGSQKPAAFTETMIRPLSMARFIRISALFSPFTINVNYQGNNASGSHVDIRIGDEEGLRIQGVDSMGSTASDGKTVSYTYITEPPGEFVPVVYLETNDGTRIWDISITQPTP